ncbi:hypothetical protein K1J08_09225 [Streptococcus sanguinis]|uniref:hypothetical protein n=1 Tax=Streptococcus sanguinis TaxID=1305 RepID=UPI001CBE6E80|nr:hypothetical protein [Streptococcus sanguinis]MBZ2038044.1 hypothetical protein [Streptococcus sanguinis]MBZ2069425.1 hypothetical protein [Streptococcus sanguinis]MBZ2071440.1 hypothetical protein [Streptococcus sanguinis]
MNTEQIIILLSGAGIGAVLSAFLVFINNSKKNKLDFITKERSEWRRDIQFILDDLGKVGKRAEAIQRLKSRINPYGKRDTVEDGDDFYLHEGHIWSLVNTIDITNTSQIEKLSDYVRLLWKYDWERSKREIKFDIFNSFIYSILVIGSISNALLILFKVEDSLWEFLLSIVSIVMIMSIFYFGDFAKKIKYWTITETVYLILLVSSMGFSIWSMLFWIIPNDIDKVDMVIPALLIYIPIIGIELNIVLKANSEEKKYIDTLKEIVNKEN